MCWSRARSSPLFLFFSLSFCNCSPLSNCQAVLWGWAATTATIIQSRGQLFSCLWRPVLILDHLAGTSVLLSSTWVVGKPEKAWREWCCPLFNAGSPNVLVIFLIPQAAQLHGGSPECWGSRPYPCTRAERFVIGSSSPEEQSESNRGEQD